MIVAKNTFYVVLSTSTVWTCLAAETSFFNHYEVALAGRHDILHVDIYHKDIQQMTA
jgi:hypothetical protein